MTKNKGGRPAIELSRDQIDEAKRLLGRRAFQSRVATDLAKKFKVGRDTAYDMIAAAQAEAVAALRGDDSHNDPLVQIYLTMLSIMCGERERTSDKIAAAGQIIKLLGLKKIADALGGADVDDFIANVLARRKARAADLDPSAN